MSMYLCVMWVVAPLMLQTEEGAGDAVAAAEARAAQLEQAIQNYWSIRKSIRGDIITTERLGDSDMVRVGGGGFMELKVDDKVLWRREQIVRDVIKTGEQEFKDVAEQRQFEIDDGEDYFVHLQGSSTAGKRKGGGGKDPRRLMAGLRKSFALRGVSERRTEFGRTFDLEWAPKKTGSDCDGGLVTSFQMDGIQVHEVCRNAAGESIRTYLVRNLQFDIPFDRDRFAFSAPEGVTVKELKDGEYLPITAKKAEDSNVEE